MKKKVEIDIPDSLIDEAQRAEMKKLAKENSQLRKELSKKTEEFNQIKRENDNLKYQISGVEEIIRIVRDKFYDMFKRDDDS